MAKIRVTEVQCYERPVVFRMPFRFGVVTLREQPQLFLRARVELEDGSGEWGVAAEAICPKWFDKDPGLTNEENFDQLRNSVSIASSIYQDCRRALKPFPLFLEAYSEQILVCGRNDLNPLVAGYGQSLLDRAILDALGKKLHMSFYELVRRNEVGIQATSMVPELTTFDFTAFLRSLEPRSQLHARHTVGLVDAITADDQRPEDRVDDGLPETLEEVIRLYGNRYFKVKIGGSIEEDLDRLERIAEVLDRSATEYFVTLDGNEQFHSLEAVLELWNRMSATKRLERFTRSILLIEQPIKRDAAFDHDMTPLSRERPVIIDESDQDLDSFPKAKYFGYRGVSSKQCKGVYKSILNRARCSHWNRAEPERFIMSAEDLTTQPGVCVQQDLCLAALLGFGHLERNGHHYVRGMESLPQEEQEGFLESHPDLYVREGSLVRMDIQAGILQIDSLDCPGLGSTVTPSYAAMRRTV